MFEKRLKGYRAIGYARGEVPLGYEEPKDDPVVVWADDAAPDFEELTVERIDLAHNDILAVCRRGRSRQQVPLLDLALPSPLPVGSEWIEAYRHWLGGR